MLGVGLQANGCGYPGGSWRVMVAAGTWCARSCRAAHHLCRNKPRDPYRCYLASISVTCGAYNIQSVCAGAAGEAAG